MEIAATINKILERKNINKTAFARKIGKSRNYVYKLSDETITVATLKQMCNELSIPIVSFFSENEFEIGNNQMVNEPSQGYGSAFTLKKEVEILRKSLIDKDKIIKFQETEISRLLKRNDK